LHPASRDQASFDPGTYWMGTLPPTDVLPERQ